MDAEMTDEKYEKLVMEAYASLNNEFIDALRKKARDFMQVWLITRGDPKQYRDFVAMGDTLADSAILWAVAEGWVEPTDKARAGDEEKAKNLAEDEAQLATLRAKPSASPVGQYL